MATSKFAKRNALLGTDGRLDVEAALRAVSTLDGGGGNFALDPIRTSGIVNGDWQAGPITGWRTSNDLGVGIDERSAYNGQAYDEWDAQGNRTGGGQFSGITDSPSLWNDAARAAAILGGTYLAGTALAGSAGSSGLGLSEAGLAGEGAFGVTNAYGGAGALGPNGAAYYASGASGLTPFAGASAGLVPPNPFVNPGPAAPASSLLSRVLGPAAASGASSWLGPAATALGALAGARGSEQSTGSERRMDPRLDGAVFGANGLVPQTQGLLNRQMSPEAQAQWAQMGQRGQGLLQQPIAGNGFAQFANRRLM